MFLKRTFLLISAATLFWACGGDDDDSKVDTSQPPADTGTSGDTDSASADTNGTVDTAQPDVQSTDTTVADTSSDTLSDTTTIADTGAVDIQEQDVGTPVECGTDSPAALAACVDPTAMMADLALIEGARPAKTPKANDTRAVISERLEALGYTVEVHDYGPGANVIATLTGAVEPDEIVMISAHYDTVPGCSGADDNGSGVVGVLEAARILATTTHDRTLKLALWDEEERGLLGSSVWVTDQVAAGRTFVVSFVFEMIGYYSDVANSQTFPQGFGFLFPAVEQQMVDNDWRGDFIAALVGDDTLPWVTAMEQHAAQNGHKVISVVLDATLRESPFLGDLRRSDHAPFWQAHYPAINLTDTANFRNPYYHCAAGDDEAKWIDEEKMGKTVAATIYAAGLALQQDNPKGVAPFQPPCDILAQDCPDNKKCSLILKNNAWYEPACTALYNDVAKFGESCIRPENVVGQDTCDKGMFCTFWGGIPKAEPQGRWCLTHCHNDNDCAADESCTMAGSTARNNGVCIKRCDPWNNTCVDTTHCVAERRGVDQKLRFGCFLAGTTAVGGACSMAFDACEVGSNCAFNPETGASQCRKPCDDSHPCDGGQQCLAAPNPPPEFPTLGYCWDN